MGQIWAPATAVAGTLLGSVVAYVFQRKSTALADQRAQAQARRQERLAVSLEFAETATALRRAAYDHWHRYQEDPYSQGFTTAQNDFYRLFGQARTVQLKLRLLTNNTLATLAHEAVEHTAAVWQATSEPELNRNGETAKQALDAFVTEAARQLS